MQAEQEDQTEQNVEIKIATRADEAFANFLEVKDARDIGLRINGKFFLIKYTHDSNRENAFLEFILNNMEFYALTEEERKKIRYSRERYQRACRRFVKNSNTGEFGEMILFFLLEVFEGAMQIVNKMALKTSGNVHYHGADSVHFGLNGDLKVLYLGESKTTEADFTKALSKSIESIEKFYNEEKDKFEVDMVSGNLSRDIQPDIKEVIEKYLDPLQPDKTGCCQTHAVFLGFEESFLRDLEKTCVGEGLIDKVTEKYKERITNYVETIAKKVENSDVSDKRFLFFLLPFKDLQKARDKFSGEVKNA